jgi:hypothetical protein
MKPNFEQMSRSELKAYVLANRNNEEAIRELFRRRNPHGVRYPMPRSEEELKQMEEIFKRRISGD